jgi:zinc transport system ATP-binding protein
MPRTEALPLAIETHDLWAGYDGDVILEGISLQVRPLDFVGLIGPNGGGKTTLLRVLLGLLPPMRGTVRIQGRSPVEARTRIGYVPQTAEFDRRFPIRVWDVVEMGRLGVRGLLKRFTRRDDQIVETALERVGLRDLARKPVGELSGGQLQRALIARALATEPDILLLDEPTSNVDPGIEGGIYELLRELNREATILLVTHDIGIISSFVKTVGCLNRHLHTHGTSDITPDMLEATYHCPVDLIAHGVPHRVFPHHEGTRQ